MWLLGPSNSHSLVSLPVAEKSAVPVPDCVNLRRGSAQAAGALHRRSRCISFSSLRALVRGVAPIEGCVFFWSRSGSMPTNWNGPVLPVLNVYGNAQSRSPLSNAGGRECGMPYCITLRSRTDARVTGWYAGRNTPASPTSCFILRSSPHTGPFSTQSK